MDAIVEHVGWAAVQTLGLQPVPLLVVAVLAATVATYLAIRPERLNVVWRFFVYAVALLALLSAGTFLVHLDPDLVDVDALIRSQDMVRSR